MLKQTSKCIIFNKLFSCLLFYIFLQRILPISTYNVSEDYDIKFEPVEKFDISPYIYPVLSFLSLSDANAVSKKTERDLDSKPIPSMEAKNLAEKFELIAESSKKFKEKDFNLSQEIEKSLVQIQPGLEILKNNEENNGNFLRELLFNFYISPILTFYKPLLDEKVKYYKSLIKSSKKFSNDSSILSMILNDAIKNDNANEDYEMAIKTNDTEIKKSNFSLRAIANLNSTDFDTKNDSVFQIIPRWSEIFDLGIKDETTTKTPTKVEVTTEKNSVNLLEAEIFFKPIEIPTTTTTTPPTTTTTTTELPKLSFTNNSAILSLFKPGEIPRSNNKKNPNSAISFKIKLPLNANSTDEKNNTYNDYNKAYIFDTAFEISASDNSGSLTQGVNNPSMNISGLQMSTTSSSMFRNLNESDVIQPKILYTAEGSMIPGLIKLTTTTTTTEPQPIHLKTAPRDHYISRMQPSFSSRYSTNSTTSKSAVKTSTTENATKNISMPNESLMNISLSNSTSVLDSQQVENATQSNSLAGTSVNSTVTSVSKETTLASSSEISNNTETKKNVKNLRKRELPINDQYDVNNRQELASYFYNGKKIHDSYLNYANSIDHELPQDFIQYQDKFSGKTELNSLGNEVINQKNQEHFQNFESGYNLQQKPASSFDHLFPNSNLKNNVEKEVSLPEKETSSVASVKSNNNLKNHKSKKRQKNIFTRKKVNSKRKNNRNGKLKKKNNRLTKGKVYRNSETGKKKITDSYSNYKNVKVRNNTRTRTRKNKMVKNKKKISKRVRSKKRNMHKKKDNTRFRDLY